ncbi:methyltransferase family protein [Algoriphagus boseongensis]|uniref:Methyltransferase family protein n=1 Tax=Algoriphagus boseongensis TaxID=1442587 RepID=A0A4R6TAX8_9BACT|nr:class I SAM-dependent methyltransferase [Algoriphagus boseongensis]TDQ19383.1 methyltransferase family protein [Algoriphagus boseongensis]
MYIHETVVHNTRAAEQVVPEIFKYVKPTSVLDVGCGIGTWLQVVKKYGVEKIKGVDGDYVNREQLFENVLPQEFVAYDLTRPFDLQEQFDLVICLEVAEHLPPESAEDFINSLCRHSDMIIFGAAIPGQGGQNHLNEQWSEYWIKLFADNGYVVYDVIRPIIWENQSVEWWYRQNMFLFTKKTFIHNQNLPAYASVIHPEHFKQKLQYIYKQSELLQKLKNELEKWETGKMGVRKHWSTFISSIISKFFGS